MILNTFKIILLAVVSGLLLTACAQNNDMQPYGTKAESNRISEIKYEALKKEFLLEIKKDVSRNSSSILNNNEPEDDLFIYKQLMKQNL